jgi:hypothetical protein
MFGNEDEEEDNQPLFGTAPTFGGAQAKKDQAPSGLFGDGALKEENPNDGRTQSKLDSLFDYEDSDEESKEDKTLGNNN